MSSKNSIIRNLSLDFLGRVTLPDNIFDRGKDILLSAGGSNFNCDPPIGNSNCVGTTNTIGCTNSHLCGGSINGSCTNVMSCDGSSNSYLCDKPDSEIPANSNCV